MGCHIDSTHTSFALHLAGAFGHRMVEKEYCLESGTEVRLGVTGEGAGEDRLTLTLYQAQRPLDHLGEQGWHPPDVGTWVQFLLSILTNPEGASLPLSPLVNY